MTELLNAQIIMERFDSSQLFHKRISHKWLDYLAEQTILSLNNDLITNLTNYSWSIVFAGEGGGAGK